MNENQNGTPETPTASHTPAPWVVDESGHVYAESCISIVDVHMEDGSVRPHKTGLVALVYSCATLGSTAVRQAANARLIAASPDLLAVANWALSRLVAVSDFTNEKSEASQLQVALRSAIAKATGTVLLLLLCVGLSACSFTKGGTLTAPTAVESSASPIDFRPMSFTNVQSFDQIAGGDPFIGGEIADLGHGENGDINISIFGVSSTGYVSARIQFVGRLETVNGSLSGDTITGFKLIADPGGTPTGTRCEYAATGAYRVEGGWEYLSGRYTGIGPAPCPNKQGQWIVKRAKALCVGSGRLNFAPPKNAMAIVPLGWPNPADYPPLSIGVFPFAVPAGTWDVTLVTGHFTNPDVDQGDEIVRVPFFGAIDNLLATVVSLDVPTADATRVTTIRNVVLSEPAVSVKVIHGYAGPPVTVPSHSVTIESVAWACPAQ